MAQSEQLPSAVKREIVQRLAEFQGLTEIARTIKEAHGLELRPQNIQYYDPTKVAGRELAADLKELFTTTRDAFLKNIDGIRISHKAAQLAALDRALTVAESRQQLPLIVTLVQAAASIAGTIKHNHEHSGAIRLENERLTDAEIDARIAAAAERLAVFTGAGAGGGAGTGAPAGPAGAAGGPKQA